MRKFATATALILVAAYLVAADSQLSGGKFSLLGNAGAVLDAATNGAAPANQVWHVQTPTTAAGAAITATPESAITTAVVVKASAGNLYGVFALNGAASTCWVEFINKASSPTLGTLAVFSVPLPASTTQPVWIPFNYPVNFSTGISVGIATTSNGSSACGTAGNLTVLYQ